MKELRERRKQKNERLLHIFNYVSENEYFIPENSLQIKLQDHADFSEYNLIKLEKD
jgi:hypothetical protein